MATIATYEEVKALPNYPEKYLIDVRDPPELAETGQIPTSLNIPSKSIKMYSLYAIINKIEGILIAAIIALTSRVTYKNSFINLTNL